MSSRSWGKILCATIASAAMVVSIGACSSPFQSHKKPANAPISVNSSEPQHGLVPSNTIESGGGNVVRYLFEGLVSYDSKNNQQMEVAQSITPNADASQYTIKLKNNWKFSNGEPVNAKSFTRAWSYCANVKNGQLASSSMSLIKGYDELQKDDVDPDAQLSGLSTPDDYTIIVNLTQPDSVFPMQLSYTAFSPLPSVAYENMQAFGQHPIGNGPYKFKAWNHNKDILVVKNNDYPGMRKAKNEGIDYRIYTSMPSAYADVIAGNLDLLDSVPQSEMMVFRTDKSVKAYSLPGSTFQAFIIPERLEHFGLNEEGNLRRQAISMAINRPLITEKLFANTRTPAVDFTSPRVPEYNKNIPGNYVLKYNVKKAQEYWKKANEINPWTGSFKIAYNADGDHQAWVNAVCNQIKNNLHIDAEGDPYATFSDIRDRIANRTIATSFRSGWSLDYPSAENYFTPLYASSAADGRGSNDGDYKNPAFDQALAQALREPNEAKRKEAFTKAQEILLADLPAIPLWISNVTAVSGKNINGVNFDYSNTPTYNTITRE